MEKQGRALLIITECASAGPFATHDEVYDGINGIANKIEDQHSPDSFDPDGRSPNRIYGPSRQYMSVTAFEGLIKYSHVSHITLINANGAFMILDKIGNVLLDKPGADKGFCPR